MRSIWKARLSDWLWRQPSSTFDSTAECCSASEISSTQLCQWPSNTFYPSPTSSPQISIGVPLGPTNAAVTFSAANSSGILYPVYNSSMSYVDGPNGYGNFNTTAAVGSAYKSAPARYC